MMENKWVALGKGVGYAAIYMGMQALVVFPVALVYGFIAGFRMVSEPGYVLDPMQLLQEMSPILILVSGILALVMIFLLLRRRGTPLKAALSWNGFSPWLIMPLIFLGFGMNLFISGVMELLPDWILAAYNESSSMLTGEQLSLGMILATVVMAPVGEEIAFRGIAMTRFRRGFSWPAALILQAVLFGLCHGQWLWILYTTFVGVVLGLVWIWLKSTPATMLVHAGFNAFSVLLMVESLQGVFAAITMPWAIGIGAILTAACMLAIRMCGATWNLTFPIAWVKQER